MVEHPPPFSALPVWRKAVLIAGLAFAVFASVAGAWEHIAIYGSAPDHPITATGQIYAVNVMHGYIRYVAAPELETYRLWCEQVGPWAGAAFMAAFFTLITYRKKSAAEN
jgi:hypothetical protein